VSDLNRLKTYKYGGHAVLMGKSACEWMDTTSVLSYFGKTVSKARGQYNSYVKEGVELGRRPELVGGGLIRSLGGWEAIKKMRIDGQERVKGDQRILGDSGFVCDVLKEADEKFERYYEMKRLGYGLDTIEDRVCEIYKIEKEDLFSRSRQKVKSDARALFCFWAHRELGYAQRDLARRLGMTQPGVGYAVIKGEAISKSNNYQIKTELLI
ncbi:MAG: transposase, partial [Pseudomonadota bacterium]